MDATQRLKALRGFTTDLLVLASEQPPAAQTVDPGTPRTKWDVMVAAQRAVAEASSTRLSERLGVDIKILPKMRRMKPRSLSMGALNALRRGVVVVDEGGFMRCPPGTPNAMEFTNFAGTNCSGGGPIARPMRVAIGDAKPRLDAEGISVVSSTDLATTRIGGALRSPRSRRQQLVEGVRRIFDKPDEGEKPNAWRSALSSLQGRNEGFSFDLVLGENANSGYAIARQGRGFRIAMADLYDEDGNPTDEGALKLARVIAANADEFTKPATATVNGKEYTAERVVLGGWHSPEDDYIYFDVSDVFPQDMDVLDAWEIGKQRDQQSIGNLAKIAEELEERRKRREEGLPDKQLSWATVDDLMNGATGALIGTDGSGGDLLDEEDLAGVNPVSLFKAGGELEEVLAAISGTNTLDLDNFTPAQIQTMLKYLKTAPGFDWIDLDNPDPDDLYLALMQLSDNLLFLMGQTSPEEREKWKRWYDIANRFNKLLANDLDLPEHLVHAVTARFSPQKDWDQNTAMSEHALRLMSDKDFTVEGDVANRALGYAIEQWETRQGDGRGSFGVRIKKAEAAVAEAIGKVETYEGGKRSEFRVAKLDEWTTKLAVAQRALSDAIAEKAADLEPMIDNFVGKKMDDLGIDGAAAVIRAHGELEGGAYLGQPLAQLTDKALAEGVSPRALLAYTTIIPDSGDPGDHSVVGNPKSRVRAQSFEVYRSVVNIYRSGGDMDVIDYELGDGAKVRSFNNNMAFPNDLMHRDTTIDTHAVAAELLVPIAASHVVTNLAFGGVDSLGTTQAYPIMRAAMIAAAIRWEQMTGEKLLPRQVQSITWEQMRALVPAKAKRYIADRVAQLQNLAGGPDGDPRFKGEAGFTAVMRLFEAATANLDELNKGVRPKDRVTRGGLIQAVVDDLGLPELRPEDILKKGTKKSSGEGVVVDGEVDGE